MIDLWNSICQSTTSALASLGGGDSLRGLGLSVSWAGYTAFVFVVGRLSTRLKLSSLIDAVRIPGRLQSSRLTSDPAECDRLLAEIDDELASHSRSTRRLNEQLKSDDVEHIRESASDARAENTQFQQFLRDRCSQLEQHSALDDRRLPDFIASLDGHRQAAGELGDVLALIDDGGQVESAVSPLKDCIEKLLDDNKRLQKELELTRRTVAQQSQKLERAEEEARVDALTGLPNRRAFDEQVARLHALFSREQTPYVVALFDVDHFKSFNDTHGHETGDEVLKHVAESLLDTKRDSDHVARFGGEEFVLLIPRRSGHQAKFVVDRHRDHIRQSEIASGDKTLSVTVSAGVAEIRRGDTIRSVLARADRALYAAKDAGRNQTCLEDGGKIVYVDNLHSNAPATV